MLVTACANSNDSTSNESSTETTKEALYYFGDTITQDGANDVTMLPQLLEGKDSVVTKLSGVISEVCQVKGCWMTMDVGEDEMRVVFKDYGFFMPKDASGKQVIIEGFAYRDTTTVDDLKHYASDAGESQAAIDSITEPEISLLFEAHGVIIKDAE